MSFVPSRLVSPRSLATGLLILVAALFGITRSLEGQWHWLGWVRAFSEAAMVGALADWFAVVALFRHPLGVPVPHTAIIPERKSDIGETLGKFVVENFLGRETVGPWFEKFNFAANTSGFLQEHSERLAARVTVWFPKCLSAFNEHKVAELVWGQLRSMVDQMPAAPALGEILEYFTADGAHEAVLNHVLQLADELVKGNRDRIREEIALEVPLPNLPMLGELRHRIAEYVADRTVSRISQNLSQVSVNPEHHLRVAFREWIKTQIQLLRNSPAYLEKGEQIKRRILNDPSLLQYAGRLWTSIQTTLLEDLHSGNSKVQATVAEFVRGIGARIGADVELQNALNHSAKKWALEMIDQHGEEIGRFIAQTVKAWDTASLSAKIEDAVGDDLQFIRLNGTLVGGLVGVLLHAIQKVLWQ
jgi:uncharacterized membrane-anchored protein YjiN (DUF445 family)